MKLLRHEFVRYLINGIIATLLHFAALSALIECAWVSSAGLANLIASTVGISASFLGSRWFVFRLAVGHFGDQALKFVLLYATFALLNGLFLWIWSDVLHRDYRIGFILATGGQLLLSYLGNKLFVYRDMGHIGLKWIRFLIMSGLFVTLLLAFNLIHNRFLTVDVVLYAAIGDSLIAMIVTAVFLFSIPYFSVFQGFEKSLLLVIFMLAGYSYAISVPTVIDRSLSFYILEKLQQRGGGILRDRIQQVFIEEYLPELRLVDVRLTEQLESGTIEILGGCIRLTPKGHRLASLSRFYRQNFLPRHRLLMGEYSDDLTNPFRHSQAEFGYTCQ